MSAATPDQATPAAVPPKRRGRRSEMPPWVEKVVVPVVFLVVAAALCRSSSTRAAASSPTCALALAYTVMALGLNIIVGFAGLLDLGFVAFYAIGAYTIGWLGSGFFSQVGDEKGWHIAVSGLRRVAAGHPHELPARARRSR